MQRPSSILRCDARASQAGTAMDPSNDQRYPIGRFERLGSPPDSPTRAALIETIEQAPAGILALVEGLTDGQCDWRYRAGGWTIRQVIHHLPDSHMHAYIRMKLAVTEDSPTVKTYDEARWAELPDVRLVPIAVSIDLLAALHRRWAAFLGSLTDSELARQYVHPDWGPMPLYEAMAMYAWHGRHHAGHIRSALRRSGDV
jgi:hypothetical protein